jgi:hypothetical protein
MRNYLKHLVELYVGYMKYAFIGISLSAILFSVYGGINSNNLLVKVIILISVGLAGLIFGWTLSSNLLFFEVLKRQPWMPDSLRQKLIKQSHNRAILEKSEILIETLRQKKVVKEYLEAFIGQQSIRETLKLQREFEEAVGAIEKALRLSESSIESVESESISKTISRAKDTREKETESRPN